MLAQLEQQSRLTGHQRLIVTAAIIADVLEFFDYFLIGFVLPIISNYSGDHATGKGWSWKTAVRAESMEWPCLCMVER